MCSRPCRLSISILHLLGSTSPKNILKPSIHTDEIFWTHQRLSFRRYENRRWHRWRRGQHSWRCRWVLFLFPSPFALSVHRRTDVSLVAIVSGLTDTAGGAGEFIIPLSCPTDFDPRWLTVPPSSQRSRPNGRRYRQGRWQDCKWHYRQCLELNRRQRTNGSEPARAEWIGVSLMCFQNGSTGDCGGHPKGFLVSCWYSLRCGFTLWTVQFCWYDITSALYNPWSAPGHSFVWSIILQCTHQLLAQGCNIDFETFSIYRPGSIVLVPLLPSLWNSLSTSHALHTRIGDSIIILYLVLYLPSAHKLSLYCTNFLSSTSSLL